MKKKLPPLALIWLYQGKDVEARRQTIAALDYPEFSIVPVREGSGWAGAMRNLPARAKVCVFWVDDGKPVGRDFLQKMTLPIIAREDERAVMHYWSGNALSVVKDMIERASIEGDHAETGSLLKLVLPVLDVAEKGLNGRLHVAFSSTERLAPLSMDPVGFPS